MFGAFPTDHQWAAQRVATLPNRWQSRLLGAWERDRERRAGPHWQAEGEAHRAANLGLLKVTAQLQAQLLELELMGQVGRLPGGLFQRVGAG